MQLEREIERRRVFDSMVNKLVRGLAWMLYTRYHPTDAMGWSCLQLRDTMTKLQLYEHDESQARISFAQEHARYLPSSLCPELQVLPDQYEIVRVERNEASS